MDEGLEGGGPEAGWKDRHEGSSVTYLRGLGAE